MKPKFKPGNNIAIKVPAHEFEKTVLFYEQTLGLNRKSVDSSDQFESVAFEFGDKNLWVDKISGMSQSEVWLEIITDNAEQAQKYLLEQGCTVRNEIEALPESFNGFWLSSPSNIIHLVAE